MRIALLDFVERLKDTSSAHDAGQTFLDFSDKIGAANAHLFLKSGRSGFRATTLPEDYLQYEMTQDLKDNSLVLKEIRAGRDMVYWGADLIDDCSQLTKTDELINRLRLEQFFQRTAVTFSMPDNDGQFRGAGVGFGFEDKRESFIRFMNENKGSIALAAFAAHAQVDRLNTQMQTESKLSPRQREILTLLAVGLQLGEIADRLGIADSTVNLHLSQLKKKLGTKPKEQALAMAITHDWISV